MIWNASKLIPYSVVYKEPTVLLNSHSNCLLSVLFLLLQTHFFLLSRSILALTSFWSQSKVHFLRKVLGSYLCQFSCCNFQQILISFINRHLAKIYSKIVSFCLSLLVFPSSAKWRSFGVDFGFFHVCSTLRLVIVSAFVYLLPSFVYSL